MTLPRQYDVSEQQEFVSLGRASSPELFVDGFSQVMIGFPISKIVFHSVIEPKDGKEKEIRKIVQTLTMPTAVAVELAKIISGLCKQSEKELTHDIAHEYIAKLQKGISDEDADISTARRVKR